MSRLSDDEKRHFTDQISMLKGENERLTKYIEDYKEDTRKVLAEECAPDEVHCTCVPVLRAENEALKKGIRFIRNSFGTATKIRTINLQRMIDALLTPEG